MVTIITPTRDRPGCVETGLRRLAEGGFTGRVILADSSTDKALLPTVPFEVTHLHLPGTGVREAMREAVPLIDTPYTLYLPDDDYVVPDTVDACAHFLDLNPAFSACTGKAIIHGPGGPARYRMRPYMRERAEARYLALMTDYTVVTFSVVRTAVFQAAWRDVEAIPDRFLGCEIFLCAAIVIAGKTKERRGRFMDRSDPPGRTGKPCIDWIATQGFAESACAFIALVSKRLADAGCETPDETARKGLSLYLARRLAKRPPFLTRLRSYRPWT